MITYEIELPPSGKKIDFNLTDDGYFSIPYVTDTIPNSPTLRQLPSQPKLNAWTISINGEYPITSQGAIDELNFHQTPRENPRSISVYAEGRANREQILNIYVPNLIKSDLWFQISKFVSQKNLPPQITLVRV